MGIFLNWEYLELFKSFGIFLCVSFKHLAQKPTQPTMGDTFRGREGGGGGSTPRPTLLFVDTLFCVMLYHTSIYNQVSMYYNTILQRNRMQHTQSTAYNLRFCISALAIRIIRHKVCRRLLIGHTNHTTDILTHSLTNHIANLELHNVTLHVMF